MAQRETLKTERRTFLEGGAFALAVAMTGI
jgi:hypothetical protein